MWGAGAGSAAEVWMQCNPGAPTTQNSLPYFNLTTLVYPLHEPASLCRPSLERFQRLQPGPATRDYPDLPGDEQRSERGTRPKQSS